MGESGDKFDRPYRRKSGEKPIYTPEQTQRYKSMWERYQKSLEIFPDAVTENGYKFLSDRSPVGYWEVSRSQGEGQISVKWQAAYQPPPFDCYNPASERVINDQQVSGCTSDGVSFTIWIAATWFYNNTTGVKTNTSYASWFDYANRNSVYGIPTWYDALPDPPFGGYYAPDVGANMEIRCTSRSYFITDTSSYADGAAFLSDLISSHGLDTSLNWEVILIGNWNPSNANPANCTLRNNFKPGGTNNNCDPTPTTTTITWDNTYPLSETEFSSNWTITSANTIRNERGQTKTLTPSPPSPITGTPAIITINGVTGGGGYECTCPDFSKKLDAFADIDIKYPSLKIASNWENSNAGTDSYCKHILAGMREDGLEIPGYDDVPLDTYFDERRPPEVTDGYPRLKTFDFQEWEINPGNSKKPRDIKRNRSGW